MKELINQILKETAYDKNPYFTSLMEGTFEKEDFIETQIQFLFAVMFFSRPMAALAAKIPTTELRLEILRNVWEEHGNGNAEHVHGKTFLTFLNRLANLSFEDVEKRTLWPQVRIFNTTLTGACVLDEYLTAAAMMGMIERMFCDISSWIGKGVVSRGWIPREKMIHYNLHEKIDIQHSQDFFDVITPSWNLSTENRYYIEQGLRLGAVLFNGLYLGLYDARKMRLMREIVGPHSRATGFDPSHKHV